METTILLSKKQAAEALSVSMRTLDYLIDKKRIMVMRIGSRVLIPRKALEQFVQGG